MTYAYVEALLSMLMVFGGKTCIPVFGVVFNYSLCNASDILYCQQVARCIVCRGFYAWPKPSGVQDAKLIPMFACLGMLSAF